MEDAAVTEWAKKYKVILMFPMMKFVMGTMCYMLSVILTSWRDLDGDDLAQTLALVIGIMSVGMVWAAFFLIQHSKISGSTIKKAPKPKGNTVAAADAAATGAAVAKGQAS